MNERKIKLSPAKSGAVKVIGVLLALISGFAILSIVSTFKLKETSPYLYDFPYRGFITVAICITVFVLMLLFNM